MPVSHEPTRHRRVGILTIALLPPCVHILHRLHRHGHKAHRQAAADDLVDPADPVGRVVGRGVAEVGSIIRVA
jgi:hypothetical protein